MGGIWDDVESCFGEEVDLITVGLPAQQTDSFLEYFLGGEVRKVCKLQVRPQMTTCVQELEHSDCVLLFIFHSFRMGESKDLDLFHSVPFRRRSKQNKVKKVGHRNPGSRFVMSFGMHQRNQIAASLVFGMIFKEQFSLGMTLEGLSCPSSCSDQANCRGRAGCSGLCPCPSKSFNTPEVSIQPPQPFCCLSTCSEFLFLFPYQIFSWCSLHLLPPLLHIPGRFWLITCSTTLTIH